MHAKYKDENSKDRFPITSEYTVAILASVLGRFKSDIEILFTDCESGQDFMDSCLIVLKCEMTEQVKHG